MIALARLAGPRVLLVPVPRAVALAVTRGEEYAPALRKAGLGPGAGWPHADSAEGLRVAADGAPGFLVVVDDQVVGECCLAGPLGADGSQELSYGLAAPARGRGIGTEAVAMLAAWAEQLPGVHRLAADVLVGNVPSRRLLERLGFEGDGDAPPYVHYVRPRPVRPGPVRDGTRPRVAAGRIAGRHVC